LQNDYIKNIFKIENKRQCYNELRYYKENYCDNDDERIYFLENLFLKKFDIQNQVEVSQSAYSLDDLRRSLEAVDKKVNDMLQDTSMSADNLRKELGRLQSDVEYLIDFWKDKSVD